MECLGCFLDLLLKVRDRCQEQNWTALAESISSGVSKMLGGIRTLFLSAAGGGDEDETGEDAIDGELFDDDEEFESRFPMGE